YMTKNFNTRTAGVASLCDAIGGSGDFSSFFCECTVGRMLVVGVGQHSEARGRERVSAGGCDAGAGTDRAGAAARDARRSRREHQEGKRGERARYLCPAAQAGRL